jgi:hypothetical protein
MIAALPTHEVPVQPAVVTAGGFQVRRREAESQYPQLEVRQNNNSTQHSHEQDIDSDDEDGGISSGDESDDDGPPGFSHSPSGVSTTIGALPDETGTPLPDSLPPGGPGGPPQNHADETTEHWAIAVGSIGARFLLPPKTSNPLTSRASCLHRRLCLLFRALEVPRKNQGLAAKKRQNRLPRATREGSGSNHYWPCWRLLSPCRPV